MAVDDAYVFPSFLTPVLTQLFYPKPLTTFLTCFCRGERRKYAGKKSRLNRGSNSQPPGHESAALTTSPPRWSEREENTVGRENASYKHFLLVLQCFQKASSSRSLKVGIVWQRFKYVATVMVSTLISIDKTKTQKATECHHYEMHLIHVLVGKAENELCGKDLMLVLFLKVDLLSLGYQKNVSSQLQHVCNYLSTYLKKIWYNYCKAKAGLRNKEYPIMYKHRQADSKIVPFMQVCNY